MERRQLPALRTQTMKQYGNIVVSPEHGALVVNITAPQLVAESQSWPVLVRREQANGVLLMLPWDEQSCRILFNCGYQEALECTPFMHTAVPLIEGKYNPLRHQALTSSFMTLYNRSYVLSEPRLGKTGSTVLAFDYLQRRRKFQGAVCIITTYTTIQSVWADAFTSTLPNIRVQIVHGPTRREDLRKPADVYITNYDSVRLELPAFLHALDTGFIGAVVVDELTHVGNSEAQRSKAICKMCQHPNARYVVGLTGSPADNPDAVFGMAKCINPGKLPCRTKGGWQRAIYSWWGGEAWQKTLLSTAHKTIHDTLMPAVRYKKADALDLPPVTEQVRECPLSAEQERAIKELKNEALTMLDSGETITAANGGVLIQRVLQVALGIIKDAAGNAIMLPHKERTQAMLDAIAETPNKTVVFSPYVAGCTMLAEEFRKAGYTAEVITGNVNGTKRAEILRAFQHEKDPHILVCHPITVGFGTELSAADTMIFAVPLLLGGFVYNQALERLSSVKQKASNINIIHIIGCQAEKKVLQHLKDGYSEGKLIAALFEDITAGLL